MSSYIILYSNFMIFSVGAFQKQYSAMSSMKNLQINFKKLIVLNKTWNNGCRWNLFNEERVYECEYKKKINFKYNGLSGSFF